MTHWSCTWIRSTLTRHDLQENSTLNSLQSLYYHDCLYIKSKQDIVTQITVVQSFIFSSRVCRQPTYTLRQISLRCALMQATSRLRSVPPLRPEFPFNPCKHPVPPGVPAQALPLLVWSSVIPVSWHWFYSPPSPDGACGRLPLPRAITFFSRHHHWCYDPCQFGSYLPQATSLS